MKKVINIGVVGLGGRGYSLINDVLVFQDNAKVIAVCDEYEDRVERAYNCIREKCGFEALKFSNFSDMLALENLDAVIISTSWESHISLAIEALKAGIPTGLEVGGAYSVEDCWKLVDTYEQTKTPFMFLENCCFFKSELLATVMARKGLFGKIVHCSGAYSHDLRAEVLGGNTQRHYRLRNYISRNCENYPTHELGPISKILDINRGNRMMSLVSVASKAASLEEYVNEHKDTVDPTLLGQKFAQGDVVSTIITCANGETILLRLDTTLPTYYSRDIIIRGTKGQYNMTMNMVMLDSDKMKEFYDPGETACMYANNAIKYEKDYLPEMWKNITEEEIKRGHGGMDAFMLKKFIQCVIDNEEMPIDVYDGASWMVITCLSAESVKNSGKPMEIPDFTRGAWKTRNRKDVIEIK